MEEVKQILGKIETDLGYFCKLFERFLDMLEAQSSGVNKVKTQMDTVRQTILANPMIQANPEAAKFLEAIFGQMGGNDEHKPPHSVSG